MSGKQDYSSLAKALEEQKELKMEYKETRPREYGIFIDEWIDVIKRHPQKFAKVIPSSDRDTSLGTLQGTTKPVKEKPDHNYLKLRKSKY